jgi:hypothetical protein
MTSLPFVMAGLDPATRQRPHLRAQKTRSLADTREMDDRLKGAMTAREPS